MKDEHKALIILAGGCIMCIFLWIYFFGNPFLSKSVLNENLSSSDSDSVPETPPTTWVTREDDNFSFNFPPRLSTKFIQIQEWPPSISIYEPTYTCTISETKDVKTEESLIGGKRYCITTSEKLVEGTPLSIYTYSTVYKQKGVTLEFSLLKPHCLDVFSDDREACKIQQELFTPDPIVDGIVESLSFNDTSL
jgi:hypothetical protein